MTRYSILHLPTSRIWISYVSIAEILNSSSCCYLMWGHSTTGCKVLSIQQKVFCDTCVFHLYPTPNIDEFLEEVIDDGIA